MSIHDAESTLDLEYIESYHEEIVNSSNGGYVASLEDVINKYVDVVYCFYHIKFNELIDFFDGFRERLNVGNEAMNIDRFTVLRSGFLTYVVDIKVSP